MSKKRGLSCNRVTILGSFPSATTIPVRSRSHAMNRVMKRKKGRLRSRSKGAERGRQGKQWNRRDEKRRQERGANRWREKSRKTHIERRLSAPCSTEWAGSSECCVSWRSKDILHRSEQRPMHLQIEIIFEVASCEIGTPFSNL